MHSGLSSVPRHKTQFEKSSKRIIKFKEHRGRYLIEFLGVSRIYRKVRLILRNLGFRTYELAIVARPDLNFILLGVVRSQTLPWCTSLSIEWDRSLFPAAANILLPVVCIIQAS